MRPEGMQVQSVLDYQRGKIERSLAYLEEQALQYNKGKNPDAADIGLACLLDYLDFRQVFDWQVAAPSLVGWITDFATSVSGYKETLPEGIAAAPGGIARVVHLNQHLLVFYCFKALMSLRGRAYQAGVSN